MNLLPQMNRMVLLAKLLRFIGKDKKRNQKSANNGYYHDFLKYSLKPSFYIPLLSTINSAKPLFTNNSFKLKDRFLFGVSAETIEKAWGAPAYQGSTNRDFTMTLFIYRSLIAGIKTQITLHFIDGKLYYFSFKFKYLTQKQKQTIFNSLEFKYLQGLEIDHDKDLVIQDNLGNYLFANNRIDLQFEYISGDEVTQHLIEYALDLRTAKRSSQDVGFQLEILKAI